jgi:hypothetical protein
MKSFRIYRANKTNNGVASEFQLSYKEKEPYNKWMTFLKICSQTGVDANENASFDWDGGLTVKLGENDLGELLAVLEGRKDSLGFKGSLFHETPGGGNKSIKLNRLDNGSGYGLSVSGQDATKKVFGPYNQVLGHNDAAILSKLLGQAIIKIYDW